MAIEVVRSTGDNVEMHSQAVLAGKLDSAVRALEQKEQEFAAYLKELNERKEAIERLKESLYNVMVENGALTLQSEHLIISAVSPSVRQNIDIKKMKSIDPSLFHKIYEKYGKDINVKGSLRIKVKE